MLAKTCGAPAGMWLVLLLLGIVVGSIVRSPCGRVVVGSLDLKKIVRGRHEVK